MNTITKPRFAGMRGQDLFPLLREVAGGGSFNCPKSEPRASASGHIHPRAPQAMPRGCRRLTSPTTAMQRRCPPSRPKFAPQARLAHDHPREVRKGGVNESRPAGPEISGLDRVEAATQASSTPTGVDAPALVQDALAELENLRAVLNTSTDRAALAQTFRRINLRLHLEFEKVRLTKREVNRRVDGTVCPGNAPGPGTHGDAKSSSEVHRFDWRSFEPAAQTIVPFVAPLLAPPEPFILIAARLARRAA